MDSRFLNISYPISPFILAQFALFFIHLVIHQPVSPGQIDCTTAEKVIKLNQTKPHKQTNINPHNFFSGTQLLCGLDFIKQSAQG